MLGGLLKVLGASRFFFFSFFFSIFFFVFLGPAELIQVVPTPVDPHSFFFMCKPRALSSRATAPSSFFFFCFFSHFCKLFLSLDPALVFPFFSFFSFCIFFLSCRCFFNSEFISHRTFHFFFFFSFFLPSFTLLFRYRSVFFFSCLTISASLLVLVSIFFLYH